MKLFTSVAAAAVFLVSISAGAFAQTKVPTTMEPGTAGTNTSEGSSTTTTTTTTSTGPTE